MEITVNINADTLAGAINNLARAMLIDNNSIAESINSLVLSASPIEAEAVKSKPEPKEEPKEEPKPELKEENVEPSYRIEDVRAAFSTFAKAKGKDKAKEILARFNSSKVTEIKESDYNAVMKVLEG